MPHPLPPLPHHTLCYCPRACIACLCFASCVFFFVAFSLFSFLFSAFFMLYFVSDVAMAANFPCRQWQRPMTGSKIGNAKSSDDDGDVNCDGSSNSDRACAAGRGRGREGDGRLVRGANSICVKNTFSCCACFKYNTQPAKKQHQQQRRRQRAVNCIIFKGTN